MNSVHKTIETFKTTTGISWNLAKALIESSKEFCEKGYSFVDRNEILRRNLLILNRSKGAESNFFIFIKAKSRDSLDIFFSNPSKEERISRNDLIIHNEIKEEKEIFIIKEKIDRALERANAFANLKEINEYWGVLHSHLGTIKDERIWDDGIT
ncbi:MAG: hypothetical protein NZ903_00270, partial [Candidatus Micrarchaeota archaeon]|nr:hypothetical protein [Candidatus Micrarchaeota archaeon]